MLGGKGTAHTSCVRSKEQHAQDGHGTSQQARRGTSQQTRRGTSQQVVVAELCTRWRAQLSWFTNEVPPPPKRTTVWEAWVPPHTSRARRTLAALTWGWNHPIGQLVHLRLTQQRQQQHGAVESYALTQLSVGGDGAAAYPTGPKGPAGAICMSHLRCGVCYSCLGHREGAYNPCPKWARIYRLMTESGSKAFPASRAPEV